ncbi:hypothetical protein GCK72_000447 [Caenorhabditis remanei]|uniref:Protein kinase domain-containing protein n=1 Tax=Caenorhabditis remanei TaxID=31234 RepID=A0A6A5HM46_CAERE|nr:hypothetical protein GCK72_000447 [Caenorhabditis remanei]KAF1768635.1 hypothetical protein GCK72_000447 [Caenorhabditis remanei]
MGGRDKQRMGKKQIRNPSNETSKETTHTTTTTTTEAASTGGSNMLGVTGGGLDGSTGNDHSEKHSNSTSSSASTGASTGGSTGEASTKGTEKKKVRNEADAMNKEMMELAANCEKNAPNADKFMLEKKNFEVTSLIRGTKKDGAYFIHDDNNNKYLLRIEPAKSGRLRFAHEIIVEMEKLFPKKDDIPVLRAIAFGSVPKFGNSKCLVLSPYALTLYEILKFLKTFTTGCAYNVGLQTLDAIKYLHQAGYILRNVRPDSFSVDAESERKIYLTGFRFARSHFAGGTKNKKVRAARSNVKFGVTPRYGSLAGMKEKDQGRKDDLESWIYMFYEMLDRKNALPWANKEKSKAMIEQKEQFMENKIPEVYKIVPSEFKEIVDMVRKMKYESAPDYQAIKSIVEMVGIAKKIDMTVCDWMGKFDDPAIRQMVIDKGAEKTVDNVFTGKDDFEVTTKLGRKILNKDDQLKSEKTTWKVVCILGSGGFGDVYKVVNDKKTPYALKTECDSGPDIRMLRLKVELQVLEAIEEARKAPNQMDIPGRSDVYQHFVELVDRGRNKALKCKFIVMSLLGPSLEDLMKKYDVNLSEKQNPYMIAIQTCNAIQDLHNIGFLHRDMKPANFAIGLGRAEGTIFMLDFGIGKGYIDPNTGKPKAPRARVRFFGTRKYASMASMVFREQGRRDDLETWLYVIYDIFDPENGLSWKHEVNVDKMLLERTRFFAGTGKFQIYVCQQSYAIVTTVKDPKKKYRTPDGMRMIVNYIRGLQLDTTPRYQFITESIRNVAFLNGLSTQDLSKPFTWVGNLKLTDTKKKGTKKVEHFSDSKSNKLTGGSAEA